MPGRITPLFCGAALLAALAIPARASADTTLDLTYDSTMDMVRPEVHPNILIHHHLQVVVSGQAVSEDRERSFRDRSDTDSVRQQEGEPSTNYVSWRVESATRLVRTERDPQSTRTMVVTLSPGAGCHLEVSNALLPGYSEFKFSRIGHRGLAYFSNYRVLTTACAVE